MIKKEKKSFSETKPFKRTTHLKTRIWDPFFLFKTKKIFSGILLLIVGVFYFIWALIKEDMIPYYSLIFLLPGIYLIIQSVQRKKT